MTAPARRRPQARRRVAGGSTCTSGKARAPDVDTPPPNPAAGHAPSPAPERRLGPAGCRARARRSCPPGPRAGSDAVTATRLPARSAWAVVPVKALDDAKQRLAAAYPPAVRRALAEAMLTDVLTAIDAAADDLAGLLVVTADPDAAALATRFGAVVEAGDARSGQTAAVTSAAWRLAREGCIAMLALPGDIPGITAGEIRAVLAAHRGGRDYVIVPAHDRRGSNAILVSPPDAATFAFGHDSFLPHIAAAQDAGFDPLVLPLPGIGLDCSNPEDMALFASRASDTHTWRLLAKLDRPRDSR